MKPGSIELVDEDIIMDDVLDMGWSSRERDDEAMLEVVVVVGL